MRITYIMFIEIWMDFQFIDAHSALEWIEACVLRNANSGEDWCDLFFRFLATGCRQNKWKFLRYKNLRFHLGDNWELTNEWAQSQRIVYRISIMRAAKKNIVNLSRCLLWNALNVWLNGLKSTDKVLLFIWLAILARR